MKHSHNKRHAKGVNRQYVNKHSRKLQMKNNNNHDNFRHRKKKDKKILKKNPAGNRIEEGEKGKFLTCMFAIRRLARFDKHFQIHKS